ncbi:hypothetical protein HS1genome_0316 [Sulfodiicoccus acidiphilus]|uniref:Uncharacterized protein n=1 Tax=Sulfodiicoccus acidiphilus TaxID=1670455 RepID=A0A348B175_9CREN|nr:hypothetical protein [Sulfodiicoccus acidiphilus]BBD71927.1 hypothetical protein HS1genome_0316 [Sulfodiicoccus acidiphilus]GGT91517.1 hypothetical protein GCM10007116_06540 [Sulfodiicoccus acidiphilus]
MNLAIVQLTRQDQLILRAVQESFESMGIDVDIVLQPIGPHIGSLDWERVQFNAETMFRWFRTQCSEILAGGYDSTAGIAEVDAYLGGYEYILSMASRGVSLNFTARLDNRDVSLYVKRVKKLVLNSWGRSQGITHEGGGKCLFSEIRTVNDLDGLPEEPCPRCRSGLQISTTKVSL